MTPKFNIYGISDNHWNHWQINRYCKRGFESLEQMNDSMTKKWNNTVRNEDLIINVGDVCFTKGESAAITAVFKKLNGRKILVKGNHDRKSTAWYLTNGWDFVCDRFVWVLNKKRILFIHDPKHITDHDYKTCHYIFHGHLHEKGPFITKKKQCKIINLSVEKVNYTPINLITMINRLKQGYFDKDIER